MYFTPYRLVAAIILRAPASSLQIGFSVKTCFCALAAVVTISTRLKGSVQTHTASTCAKRSRKLVQCGTPIFSARALAFLLDQVARADHLDVGKLGQKGGMVIAHPAAADNADLYHVLSLDSSATNVAAPRRICAKITALESGAGPCSSCSLIAIRYFFRAFFASVARWAAALSAAAAWRGAWRLACASRRRSWCAAARRP